MKISTKGRYALRVMVDLALHNTGEYIPLKEVAARQGLTVKYLEQIVSQFSKSGDLRSSRGNNGGYCLSRSPEEYTVGGILRTTEGSMKPVACLETSPNQCKRKASCPTLWIWEGLDRVIAEYLDSITLEDVLEKTSDFQGFCAL